MNSLIVLFSICIYYINTIEIVIPALLIYFFFVRQTEKKVEEQKEEKEEQKVEKKIEKPKVFFIV